MKKALIFFAVLLFLPSCATTYTDEQLSQMNDDEICKVIHQHPTDMHYLYFMMGRKLNCHPAQEACLAAGYKIGTKNFGECTTAMVNDIFQKEEERQQRAQAIGQAVGAGMQGMSNYYATNPGYIAPTPAYTAAPSAYSPPVQTRCTTSGGNKFFPQQTVNCTQY